MAEERPVGKNCPFVAQPMPGCRVNKITSQTIPDILECCGDRFAECPLFKNKQADGESKIDRNSVGAKNLLPLHPLK